MAIELYGVDRLPCTHDTMEGGWVITSTCFRKPIMFNFSKSKLALSEQASAFDSQAARAKLKLGLLSYPVLQAADILLYG